MNANKGALLAPPNKRPATAFPKADREMTSLTTTQQEYLAQAQKNSLPFLEFIDPAVLKRRKAEIARKKYDQLLEKVQFYDADKHEDERRYKYTKETLMPYILFTKYLARKPDMPEDEVQQSKANRLKIWIPDTIVLNDDQLPPMWFYSSPEGFVYRTDAFTSKTIAAKLSNYASPDELVAVVKKIQFKEQTNICGNSVKLVSSRDALATVINTLQIREATVIQKFVKSNGPKAFICRTVWRKDKNPFCWIITNKADYYSEEKLPETQKYITNASLMNTCTIVNTCRGKYVDETIPYIKNILKYMHNTLGLSFQEFVCDFIKDESGIWWMINVKAFVFEFPFPEEINTKKITNHGDDLNLINASTVIPQTRNKTRYQKVKTCKYCETVYPENELNRKMTLKMIIQTDKHLMHRSKNFPWLARSLIKQIDTPSLYEQHKVCKTCYTLYTETEKLIQQEFMFAKLLGVPCNDETKHSLVSLNQTDLVADSLAEPTNISQLQTKHTSNSPTESSWVMDIGPNTQLIVKNNQPTINNKVEKHLDRYRVMVLLHFLRDIPDERDSSKSYYLEYTMLDQKVRYRLPIYPESSSTATLNKMRIFYLFTNNRKGINSYINAKQVLSMNLFCDSKKIGQLDLELQDFLSDKVIKREYYKMFSGKTLPSFPLKWGLNLTIGMFSAGPVDVSKIKLTEHEGIYLPSPDYYTCEPLPAEWMQIIHEKIQFIKRDNPDKTILTERDKAPSWGTAKDATPLEKRKLSSAHLPSSLHSLKAQTDRNMSNGNSQSQRSIKGDPSLKKTHSLVGKQAYSSSSPPHQSIFSGSQPQISSQYASQQQQQQQYQFGSNNEQLGTLPLGFSQIEEYPDESTRIFDEMLLGEMNTYSKENNFKQKTLRKKLYY